MGYPAKRPMHHTAGHALHDWHLLCTHVICRTRMCTWRVVQHPESGSRHSTPRAGSYPGRIHAASQEVRPAHFYMGAYLREHLRMHAYVCEHACNHACVCTHPPSKLASSLEAGLVEGKTRVHAHEHQLRRLCMSIHMPVRMPVHMSIHRHLAAYRCTCFGCTLSSQ